ncbi:MAG: molybdenum cofactor guanylyltransferase MobA [Roseitalea sp.]|nr:molybdenum cofactor guanylyltransferase MobA [Roseitalea sp.]MBO6950476.1 molybdenum cofactor guanylyltransferase MobA [Rhizobiaceae bacterium]MBO6591537.1 molybdenum cofactor guanylyltransferase MobA [Roseitalea sp.]MBO6599392.1 molybdenum cofactor guanylyltransferase MobA [Roseitalea sp.]MBO6612119.1 molybdenum cofactor guanylyltransferase MobA [Roseitalea sp.]
MTDTAPQTDTILGVVLAGGRSSRMGGTDKALIALAGKLLIAHVAERLAPQVGAMAVNANGDAARFDRLGLPVFADTIGGHAGPLAGVLAAMRFASDRGAAFTHVATAATDTPFFPTDLVTRLAAAATTPDTIAMAASDGNRHPVFALWPTGLAGDLESWLAGTDTFKVMAWAKRHRFAPVEFGPGPHGADPFFNINTPEDLTAAERQAQAALV